MGPMGYEFAGGSFFFDETCLTSWDGFEAMFEFLLNVLGEIYRLNWSKEASPNWSRTSSVLLIEQVGSPCWKKN